MTRLLMLLAGPVLLWAVAALAARGLGAGDDAVLFGGAAVALCVAAMAVTVAVVAWSNRQDPQLRAVIVLACSGLRIFLVLGGGMALAAAAPAFRRPAFWAWLLAAYLTTLALEVRLALAEPGGAPPK